MLVKFSYRWISKMSFWNRLLFSCNSSYLILQNRPQYPGICHKQNYQQQHVTETNTTQRILFLPIKMHPSQIETINISNPFQKVVSVGDHSLYSSIAILIFILNWIQIFKHSVLLINLY